MEMKELKGLIAREEMKEMKEIIEMKELKGLIAREEMNEIITRIIMKGLITWLEMKEMKVESILATPFYKRLLFFPWILTQALVAKLAIF